MAKILINDGIHPDGKLLLEDAGHEVHTEKIEQADLAEKLPAYDVICVRSATKVRTDLIDKCPNLKAICRGGVGLDNIDVEHAKSKGIEVYNTPAASSQAVAELVFAHAFNLARFVHHANRDMPTKGDSEFKGLKKSYSKGIQLRGRKMGILGFGNIGQETARIALGLGMQVLPVDLVIDELELNLGLYDSDTSSFSVKVKTVGLDKMLAEADVISLHVPGGKNALIGAAEFAKMKDGVIIINAARGGTIDEDALLDALNSGKVRGAGLDVYVNEPTPRKDLLEHPNISLTPHIGASTGEAQRNIGVELAEKIIALFE